MQKPSIPKGTRNFSPEEMAKRNYIFDTIKSLPTVWFSSNRNAGHGKFVHTLRKYGEEGDKLLFKILNSGNFLSDITIEDLKKEIQQNSNQNCRKRIKI